MCGSAASWCTSRCSCSLPFLWLDLAIRRYQNIPARLYTNSYLLARRRTQPARCRRQGAEGAARDHADSWGRAQLAPEARRASLLRGNDRVVPLLERQDMRLRQQRVHPCDARRYLRLIHLAEP